MTEDVLIPMYKFYDKFLKAPTNMGREPILLEVTPKARQPLFFWRLLLKPGSPYCSPVCLYLRPSRSHVHTSGTNPAFVR